MEELNYTSAKIFTCNKQGELIEKRVKAAQVCPGLLVTPEKSGLVDLIIEYNGIKWREAQAPAARIDNVCKRIPGILKNITEGHLLNLSDFHKEMHRRIFTPDAPAVMELKKPERKKSAPLPDGAIKTTVLIADFGGKVSEKELVLTPICPGAWLNTYKLKRYGERVRIILELDGIYFQGADLGAFVTEHKDFTERVSNAAAHARQNVIEGAAKGITLLVAVNERINTTQPTETPQISAETAKAENVTVEDKTTAETANKLQNPTIKKFLNIRTPRTTGGAPFWRGQQNACRIKCVLSEASAIFYGECSAKIVPRLFDKYSTALPP